MHSHIPSLFLVSRNVPIDAATARLACCQLRARVALPLAPVCVDSAGELTEEEIETVKEIIAHPRQFSIPDWFLNRQKDVKTGKFMQLTANQVDTKYREDLERMKKIRCVAMSIARLSTHFPWRSGLPSDCFSTLDLPITLLRWPYLTFSSPPLPSSLCCLILTPQPPPRSASLLGHQGARSAHGHDGPRPLPPHGG